MLPGSAVPHVGVRVLPHHVVDGAHDVRHLLARQRTGGEGRRITERCTMQEKEGSVQLLCKQTEEEVEFGHLSGDAAIFVEIIQVKGPVQFVSDGAS